MQLPNDLLHKVLAQQNIDLIYAEELGYIVWRNGTGDNIEVIFIRAADPGHDQGRELYKRMCKRLLERGDRPYHSVYSFRLGARMAAGSFYSKLNWFQTNLGQSIYGGDETVIMWIPWEDLLQELGLIP